MESIMDQIEAKRQEMIDNGMEKGFLHPDTIQSSIELDQLLNELNTARK